ncbi:amino acid permease NDAI_0F04200 [Naumovozyma dairenensis CBS 421]|uniref:Amino acid permease/ SLC12A domain-containing protein n=1 Tax=Naumovozyma dairenensis (strain ATCC 10597 / BCRC 20456 / CBS 421 / NBRC 0211 / NRRL Y-12639) TaxID=1071378 RepID=G0WD77_NAUDC|nr:hypothetical protein NDAI_0F04200 [Naumovozyma dairenensis CBS 421]CCD25738.1 hypothetical protein NDAI_0F04200 [Naumovozyma dairenensis CBS 421]
MSILDINTEETLEGKSKIVIKSTESLEQHDLQGNEDKNTPTTTPSKENVSENEKDEYHEVKRDLSKRHIAMIALGGTIGTGLFLGIANPLMISGPVGSLIAYLFLGTVVYSVTQSLGEMATFIPVTASFTIFSHRFLSPALGAANGYMYWFSWAMTFALELSVVGQIIQFWTFAVPLPAWISIFWVILTISNLFPVRIYGEIEFWIAFLKVNAILGFIIYCFCIVCGAGKTGPVGFRYWRNPGPWGTGIISSNIAEARFLGWASSLINAAFTFQGTELVGITAGEAANPRQTVPKAIRKVVFRILVFYILSLFFIGLLVPYDDVKLKSENSYVSSSPFIIAIENSGTKILPHIFNGVILVTIISAGNSNVYIGSRLLFGLAKNGTGPKLFAKTTKSGVPVFAVVFTSLFGALAFMETSTGGDEAFQWLLNVVGVAGFFSWLLISFAHIRFMQCLQSRGISRNDLPFKAKFMPYLAYYATIVMIIIIFFQGFTAFAPKFDVLNFFASYISVFLFFIFWGSFQLWFKCRYVWKLVDIDIDKDRREIEDRVWQDTTPANLWGKFWDFVA